jgi:P-type Ca2+ transporter type 2C
MIWIGVVGIHDPLREGVVEAVAQCQRSGVVVRMVTGDNVTTARAIATECGIMTDGAVVMEGPAFRQLSDNEMNEVLPKLRVLARSSPEDKRILVKRLKQLGETVAVTGDGTNDGPALKMADVGFSMGIAGTEVAKEASSIILLDDNFSSIITAIAWGRSVNDAVKKFLQFQITVNITAVTLTFVSAVSNSSNHSVLTAVQLLWVNLIMDTLAALALATDAPTNKILQRDPEPKSAPLITINMWKMITGQAVYQLAVTFVLYFAGSKIFTSSVTQKELDTMVFNTFVWMQIFNELNNRRLDNKFNIFEGVHRNFWFIGINCIMVGGQIMIVFVGGAAFGITRINGWQWAVCLLCSLPCLLWAVLLRLVPDAYFGVVFNGVVGTFKVVLAPVSKALHFILLPVVQAWRAVMTPMKRTSKRMAAKVRGKKAAADTEAEVAPIDEEVAVSSPMPPLTNLPPITLTAPS